MCVFVYMGIYTRVIEKCVLDMDHYCPWMNNCVGRRNYRYFILYLIYMVVGCVFVITFVIMESVALTANERFSSIRVVLYEKAM